MKARTLGISTIILSVSLMMLFVPGFPELLSQDVFALKSKGNPLTTVGSSSPICGDRLCSEVSDIEMKSVSSGSMKGNRIMKNIPAMNDKIVDYVKLETQIQQKDGVGLEFRVPETIFAKQLTPINARVLDTSLDANLSHTDWSYTVTNSDGDIIHKSTTLHGHFGIMNFKDSFPESGTYTITYSVLSSGSSMLGMPVPEIGQTRAVVTGDILRFEEDPKNDFGSRTFEFTVDVSEPEQIVILEGSEPGDAYSIKLTTQPEKVIAGQPVTIVLDVDDYHTGNDATHVDGLISIIPQDYYQSASGDQPDAPVVLHGAYHGHLGLISTTQTFPKSGTVLLKVDLSTIPYSKPLFGKASTQFTIQVVDSTDTTAKMTNKTTKENTVDIVGIESPFFTPNTITVHAGQAIVFDNVDANYHTVTSAHTGTTEHDGKFDSGLLNAGESYELTIDEQGTYDYFCALHTGMRGTIIVS